MRCGGKLAHPSRELVAFAKTKELNPQESDTVKIEFKISDMASYDDDGTTGNKSCFVLEKGEYNIYIGTDVRSAAKRIYIFAGEYGGNGAFKYSVGSVGII